MLPRKSTSPPKTTIGSFSPPRERAGGERAHDKHDVSRRMPRNLPHLKAHPREFDDVAFMHDLICRRADDRESERAPVQIGVRQQRCFVGADDERRLGKAQFHRFVARDVVGVAVRVEDRRDAQLALIKECEDRVRFQAGIEHERRLRHRQTI